MTKDTIIKNFYTKNPDFPQKLFHIYVSEKNDKQEFFVFLCNYGTTGKWLTQEEINKFLEKATDEKAVDDFCLMFMDKNNKSGGQLIDVLTTYCYKKGVYQLSKQEIVDVYVKNNSKNEDTKPKLHFGQNTIVGYKVDEDGEIDFDAVITVNVNFEKIKSAYGTEKRRCFISDAETREGERRKGLYSEVINTLLPNICRNAKVSGIVLNASEFDSNKGQKKLENYYKDNGFTKIKLEEIEDFPLVKENDFDEGLPVYFKQVEGMLPDYEQ